MKEENKTPEQLIQLVDTLLGVMSDEPTLLEVSKSNEVLLKQVELDRLSIGDYISTVNMLRMITGQKIEAELANNESPLDFVMV